MRNRTRSMAYRRFTAGAWLTLSTLLLTGAVGTRNACPWCTPPVSMNEPRALHTATRLPGGLILIVGGLRPNGSYSSDAEIFNSKSRTFSQTGTMPIARGGHTATLLRNGNVLVAGGYADGGKALASALLFNPSTSTFISTGAMTAGRGSHSAILLPDGKVLVVGGKNDMVTISTAEIYDPVTGTFSATGPMHSPRAYHASALTSKGVLIAGGTSDNQHAVKNAELYNPKTAQFSTVGEMNVPRSEATATTLKDGRVLLTGGWGERRIGSPLASAEIFDTRSGLFSLTGAMGSARSRHAAVLLNDGSVLIAGGAAHTIEIFNPLSGSFRSVVGGLDSPKYYSTATLLPDGGILLIGGYGDMESAIDKRGLVIGPQVSGSASGSY
jgi:Galactose oxidase, central domain/Kelch motif